MVGRAFSVLVLAVVALIAVPGTAEAADGTVLSSENVFRIDPDRPAVTIESTYRMTNVKPNRQLGGGAFEYYYFTGVVVPIFPSASEITVEINGRDGDFEIVDEDGYRYLDIDLGYQLRYDKTATIVVRSVLLGDPPRDEDSWVRVNPAYASFDAWGWGDDGEIDVRIELPGDWTPEYVGDDLAAHYEDGMQVFEATGIDDPLDWAVIFTGRFDELLDTSRASVGDADFEIRSWPGDTTWVDYATEQIVDGIPVLEELLDTPWPVSVETEVIEASTPYLSGYAGFYDSSVDVIEIGEDLDRVVFLHELSHAWVNGDGFVDRWIIEGLAEEIASRAVAALGDELPEPLTDADLASEGVEVEAFPLNTWSSADAGDDDTEDYGYAASFRAVRALRDEIGEEAMTELLRAALAGERAYPDEDGTTHADEQVDWREFLDLAEQIGGSTEFEDVYRDLVLTESQIEQLDRRNDALDAYHQLVDRSGSWHPPEAVRDRLAGWQLQPAEDAIADAEVTLDLRDELLDVLAPLGLTSPSDVEEDYQDETVELDEVRGELADLIAAAERLVVARSELAEVLGSIEQDVPELSQTDFDESPDGAVTTTDQLVDDAEALVTVDRRLDDVLAGHDLSVPALDPNAFVVDRGAALSMVTEQLETATIVESVHDARDGADSIVARIGLLGSDVDDDLAQLDGLLADGDTTGAADLADAIAGDIDDLDAAGVRRVVAAGGALAFLLLVVLATSLRRRRRVAAVATSAGDVAIGGAGAEPGGPVFPPPTVLPTTFAAPPPSTGDAADSGNGATDLASPEADVGEAGSIDSHH